MQSCDASTISFFSLQKIKRGNICFLLKQLKQHSYWSWVMKFNTSTKSTKNRRDQKLNTEKHTDMCDSLCIITYKICCWITVIYCFYFVFNYLWISSCVSVESRGHKFTECLVKYAFPLSCLSERGCCACYGNDTERQISGADRYTHTHTHTEKVNC